MERQAEALLEQLRRIADTLEGKGVSSSPAVDWLAAPAYAWAEGGARAIMHIDAPEIDLLRGIDAHKLVVLQNVRRLAAGLPAHDMLLWGARGTGKSALIRSAVQASRQEGAELGLVQVAAAAIASLPDLFVQLATVKRQFLIFCDDLGFAAGDAVTPRHLRSWLDGGVEARPRNCRLAVTSNQRAIVQRGAAMQDDPLNPRDELDDQLALADRFGLSLGFHVASQDAYLEMVRTYARFYGLAFSEAEALLWSKRRGARSGRVAWHFIVELAGREGLKLT